MAEIGQVWASGERTVRVIATHTSHVVVHDTYGWRRALTHDELKHGFRVLGDRVERVRGVMGRRALADLDPA